MRKPDSHFIEKARTLTLEDSAWLLSEAYDMAWDYEHLGHPCSAHRGHLAEFMRNKGLNPFKQEDEESPKPKRRSLLNWLGKEAVT